jgi:hypothetical protein
MNNLTRSLKRLAALFVLAAPAVPLLASQTLTLAWEPSTDAAVKGYRIHCQIVDSTNAFTVDAGSATLFAVTGLSETVTYTFFVTAYDRNGLESDPSNAVEYTVPLGAIDAAMTRDQSGRPVMKFSAGGVPGQRLALQSSSDLLTWKTVWTGTLGGALSCAVTNSTSARKEFYRTVCVP